MRRARDAADEFFESIADWYRRQPAGFNGRVRKPIGLPETLAGRAAQGGHGHRRGGS